MREVRKFQKITQFAFRMINEIYLMLGNEIKDIQWEGGGEAR